MTESAFTITIYDGSVVSDVLDETSSIYREVYAEPPYMEGTAEHSAFASDLPRRAKEESFRLVVARRGDNPLGFAMGHRLSVSTRWWEGALTSLPADVTTEYPGRTFAIIELAVFKPYRQQRLGSRLHTHLTAGLSEARRTLLVRPEATAAQIAYVHWNYQKIGLLKPAPGAPVYDVMIAPTENIER